MELTASAQGMLQSAGPRGPDTPEDSTCRQCPDATSRHHSPGREPTPGEHRRRLEEQERCNYGLLAGVLQRDGSETGGGGGENGTEKVIYVSTFWNACFW